MNKQTIIRVLALNLVLITGLLLISITMAKEPVGSKTDPYTIRSAGHLLKDIEPIVDGDSGRIRAVVEIPAFTRAKWEVDDHSGHLIWEFKKGKPRVVKYAFPYPANYGMIPQTVQAASAGGDGDPLDVVILGASLSRASVADVRVIGIMRMIDDGEVDDKILAVSTADSYVGQIATLEELKTKMPGTLETFSIWFKNYKLKPDEMQIKGFDSRDEAIAAVRKAHTDFKAGKK